MPIRALTLLVFGAVALNAAPVLVDDGLDNVAYLDELSPAEVELAMAEEEEALVAEEALIAEQAGYGGSPVASNVLVPRRFFGFNRFNNHGIGRFNRGFYGGVGYNPFPFLCSNGLNGNGGRAGCGLNYGR